MTPNDAPVLSRGGRGMDKTEIGHSCSEGRLLVGHGPRGVCVVVAVDSSFVEQPGRGVGRFGGQTAAVSSVRWVASGAEVLEGFAGDVALEDADDLAGRLAFGAAPGDVVLGRLVRAHAGDHDAVEGVVGLAVAAAVEPVTAGLARGRLEGGDAAEVGECRFVAQPFGVVAGGDEQLGGDVVADTVQASSPGAVRSTSGRIAALSSSSSSSRSTTRRPGCGSPAASSSAPCRSGGAATSTPLRSAGRPRAPRSGGGPGHQR